jgi:hypothetical protein
MGQYRTIGNRLQAGQAFANYRNQRGRVALVTGGTDGVGRAIAQLLAASERKPSLPPAVATRPSG